MTSNFLAFLDRSIDLLTNNICCQGPDYSKTAPPQSRSTPSASVSRMIMEAENPFGSKAVGDIKSVSECGYENMQGLLYITSRAICFRGIGLFGFEVDRIIISFGLLQDLMKNQQGNDIIVTTNNDGNYCFSGVGNLDEVVNLMNQTWEEAKDSPSTLQKSAVKNMFRSITTLSTETDSMSMSDLDTEVDDMLHVNEQDKKQPENIVVKKLWNQLNESIVQREYTHKVIMNVPLSCSVDQFHKLFLADNVACSLGTYHEHAGDFDVKETKWESLEGGDFQRQVQYKHPINVPMAPPHGSAEKTQTLKRFEDYGLCVITKAWVNDVPMTDCFYVEDCLLVSSNPEGGVYVSIRFDLCFVKSTMFKKIISMNAMKDVSKFQAGFVQYIQDRLEKIADTSNIPSDLVFEDDEFRETDNAIEQKSVCTKKRHLFETIKKNCAQTFITLSTNVPEIKPLVWLLLMGLLINQLFLSSQVKNAQEKIAQLEFILDNL